VAAHVNLGDHVWFGEGPAAGQRYYEAGIEVSERRGAGRSGDWARMQTMWTRYDLGEWDAVLEVGERILEGNPLGGEQTDQLSVLADAYRRDVLLHRRRPGEHEQDDLVETTLLPRARDIADGQVVVPVFRVAALGRLARGDVAGAVALVEEADELLRTRPGFRSWLLDWASRVCLAAGEADLLRRLVGVGVEHLRRDRNSLAGARAVLHEIDGDNAAAVSGYEDAAERWERFPSVLEHGLALAGAGRCLLALSRPEEALGRLRRSRERFASLGAAWLVEGVDEALALAVAKSS
jgi:hypothetical protein